MLDSAISVIVQGGRGAYIFKSASPPTLSGQHALGRFGQKMNINIQKKYMIIKNHN